MSKNSVGGTLITLYGFRVGDRVFYENELDALLLHCKTLNGESNLPVSLFRTREPRYDAEERPLASLPAYLVEDWLNEYRSHTGERRPEAVSVFIDRALLHRLKNKAVK